MKRKIEQSLLAWRQDVDRFPLLVRGARQTGKTYLIEHFGQQHFKQMVVINFELQPQLKQCFSSLQTDEIISKLQLLLNVTLSDSDTLLFLDEIQECPSAIMSLRYFREQKPGFPVIGAGSLLEFALNAPDFKMPVGRVHFLYLEPLSFDEYLQARGQDQLRNYLETVTPQQPPDGVIHDRLMELMKEYFLVGGMPAAVASFCQHQDFMKVQLILGGLHQTFRSDFGKYSRSGQYVQIGQAYDAIPQLIGNQIKYVQLDPHSKSRDVKNALNLLSMAGLILLIYATDASLPLGAQINPLKFKINMLDVGLMQHVCGIASTLMLSKDIVSINSGALAEQFVGQELRCLQSDHEPHALYYWVREQRSSNAEVDYLTTMGGQIIPIEVKSGKTGRLRSLRIILEEKKLPLGVRLSLDTLSVVDNILTVPLYMINQTARLVARESGVV